MRIYRYRVVIEQDESDMYVASCPVLQGCYTQGETYQESLTNIREAIIAHIKARQQVGEPLPIEVAIEEVEVSA